MAEHDPLDRALAYLEAIVLPQFDPRVGERLIGGKISDRALQRPRTCPMRDFRAQHERANTFLPKPILRL
jgi:hypothetical protein